MRTITITLYKYDELPSAEAQAKARDWWRNCECAAPSWYSEHRNSMQCAINACKNCETDDDWKNVLEESRELKWSGYCADAILSDVFGDDESPPPTYDIRQAYERAWQDECEYNMQDDNVAENICANEYEFTADGSIA